uniref:tRNA (uracil(54)-C(5))-methyltransferase n=1 Tax=Daphnia galeata TaxID=27404 RepID=A0A8J2RR75_9CRUS|nr:unnamed protein product [Daphnia galeata]
MHYRNKNDFHIRYDLSGRVVVGLFVGKASTNTLRCIKADNLVNTHSTHECRSVVSQHTRATPNSALSTFVLVHGQSHIYEQVGDHEFRISPPESFFQINTQAARLLYDTVSLQLAPKRMSTVVDLCCGTGTQGLMVARHARGVIGIELSKSAVEDARSTKDSPIGIVFSVSLATSNKKRIGNRWIHFNSTSPCEPSEKKRARKHAHVNSPLLAVNQYESGRHETDWTRRPRRFSSFLRTSSKFSNPRRRRYKQRLAGKDSQTNSKLRVKTRVSAQRTASGPASGRPLS